jgi:hypothetical protein
MSCGPARRDRRAAQFRRKTARFTRLDLDASPDLIEPIWSLTAALAIWNAGRWGTWRNFDFHRLLRELPRPDLRLIAREGVNSSKELSPRVKEKDLECQRCVPRSNA